MKVAADSLQVGPSEIATLSTAVRVAGPSITWIRDTRDSPLDSHRGTYTSFQDFRLGPRVWSRRRSSTGSTCPTRAITASTRTGLCWHATRATGRSAPTDRHQLGCFPCLNACMPAALLSHRGFSINAAGPRDPETGFPIGGAGALVNSTEVRLPPPMLPFFGDTLSFVLFHDMGNVFTNAGDAWVSALRIHQPDRDTLQGADARGHRNPRTPPSTRQAQSTSTGPAGPMQLQLLLPCGRPGHALPYAGRTHPARFQL